MCAWMYFLVARQTWFWQVKHVRVCLLPVLFVYRSKSEPSKSARLC